MTDRKPGCTGPRRLRKYLTFFSLLTLAGTTATLQAGEPERSRFGVPPEPAAPAPAAATREAVFDENIWQTPELVPNVNIQFIDESGPWVSADGLTLVFSSNRPGSTGGDDLYIATRASRGEDFGAQFSFGSAVNTTASELAPSLTEDQLVLVFSRIPDGGTFADQDLFIATRATTADDFGNVQPISGVNSPSFPESYPWISADGLTLWYTTEQGTGPDDLGDIWVATRPNRNDSFSGAQRLDTISSDATEFSFSLSPDGLEAWVARDTGLSVPSIHVARRATTGAPFPNPAPVPSLASRTQDLRPVITEPPVELYFMANRRDAGAAFDVYRTVPVDNTGDVWVLE